MTKPVLNLTGDPRDRGRAHGEIMSKEIDGVLDGSGRSLEEITLLNVRYELLVGMMKSNAQTEHLPAAADGCTSFAVLRARSAR